MLLIRKRAFARAGLIGNPSDGYHGRTISISVLWAPADRATIDSYAKLGVERVVFPLQSEGREQILPQLDRYAELLR